MVDLNRWFDGAYQIDAERAEDAEGSGGNGGGEERASGRDGFDRDHRAI
jgi:hypothetical protein